MRIGTVSIFLFATAALLSACGDSGMGAEKLKNLSENISTDSLFRVIGTGPLQPVTGSDSIRIENGYRRSQYFMDGASYKVLWYREVAAPLDSAIIIEDVAPIVIRNDSVIGWGWKYFDKASVDIGLPNPKTTLGAN